MDDSSTQLRYLPDSSYAVQFLHEGGGVSSSTAGFIQSLSRSPEWSNSKYEIANHRLNMGSCHILRKRLIGYSRCLHFIVAMK